MYLFWLVGVFDSRQRHQIKNGHKIGKCSFIPPLSISHCLKLMNVIITFQQLFHISLSETCFPSFKLLTIDSSLPLVVEKFMSVQLLNRTRAATEPPGPHDSSDLFICHVCRRATRRRGAVMESRSQSLRKRPASSAVAFSEDRGLRYWLPAGWTQMDCACS